MDVEKCWKSTLALLEKSLTEVTFHSIIMTLTPINYSNNVLTLKTSDDFFKTPLNGRILPEINRCLRSVTGTDIEAKIVSPEDFNDGNTRKKFNEGYAKTNLRQKYAFETFVKGKSNELAYAAAYAVAEAPGKTGYNPLFLYGGVGLGKTHLVQSIGNYVYENNPNMKVMYVSTETFTNDFVFSIREKTTQQFKSKYRDIDVLLLDDVQFLHGKEETQEELFHTFNTLYNDSKQIVLTSDQPPKDLNSLEKRLTSRFAWGLLVDVTLPDLETRIAILDKKLAIERLVIPNTVKEFIIRNVISNIRDMEGALNKITAYARLTNTPITLELAENALKDQLAGGSKPVITVEYIQQIVAEYYNISVAELVGRKRTQNLVFPRQIAMYLSRKILDVSTPQVGQFFGGRDHTTVLHSCEKIADEIDSDSQLKNVVDELERKIKGDSTLSTVERVGGHYI